MYTCTLTQAVLLHLPYHYKPMCRDTPGLISTAYHIIPQSCQRSGRVFSVCPVSVWGYSAFIIDVDPRSHVLVIWLTTAMPDNRHSHSSIWLMNLVKNNTLGRIVALSIWQCYCIIKSPAAVHASMNPPSLSLTNQEKSYSYPTKGNREWKFCGCLGQVLCMSFNPKVNNKYPSSVIPGYIDFVWTKPLPSPPFLGLATQWLLRLKMWTC
jgi:hypothetical protein